MRKNARLTKIFKAWVMPLMTAIGLSFVWFTFFGLLDLAILMSVEPMPYIQTILIGLFVAVPGLVIGASRKTTAIVLSIFGIATIGLNFNNFGGRKEFVWFYRDIHHGMTVAEIQQKLDQHFPTNGKYPKPIFTQSDPKNCSILRDRQHRDRDEILISLDNSKVVNAGYIDD
jgi:hypothetical protein